MTVTAILPVTDETTSLRKTVEVLLAENRREISEILIVACQRTTPAAWAVAEELGREHAGLIQVRLQQRPFLGGAMRDAFDWASGSHVCNGHKGTLMAKLKPNAANIHICKLTGSKGATR